MLFASLIPRVSLLAYFSANEIPPYQDEGGYFLRAEGAARALGSLPHIDDEGLYLWYGRGKWPPLYPLLLTAGFPFFEDNVVGARTVNVILSSLTTLLVYLVGIHGTRRSGIAIGGAVLHIIHPTIIVYSNFLWSETAYTFFVLLSMYLLLLARRKKTLVERRNLYLFSGVVFGATALIRAASLPLLFLLPLWILLTERRRPEDRSKKLASCFVAAILLVVVPYEVVLCAMSKSFVLLSTASDYNAFFGNNPWVPLENGSSWGDGESSARIHKILATGKSPGKLVRQEIVSHPGRFLARSFFRWRMLWSPDFFPLRHIITAATPPIALAGILGLLIATLLAFSFVLVFGIYGLALGPRLGGTSWSLTLLLMAGLAVGPVLTIAMSRLHFTMVVLLLPFAALGLYEVFKGSWTRRSAISLTAALAFLGISLSSLPLVFQKHLHASSYYAPLLFPIAEHLDRPPDYFDRLRLRATEEASTREVFLFTDGEELTGNTLGPYRSGSGWNERKVSPRTTLQEAGQNPIGLGGGQELEINLYGSSLKGPIRLGIHDTKGNSTSVTVSESSWGRWSSTGMPGIEYRWE